MRPEDITQRFDRFLTESRVVPFRLTPSRAIELMVEFRRLARFDWVEDQEDADMLLFQYGVHDWGQGENFELNITRQLMRRPGGDVDDDENMFQLGLTLFYRPEPYKGIRSFNRWSIESPSIEEYVQEIVRTEGYLRACADNATRVETRTETV